MQNADIQFIRILRPTVCNKRFVDANELVVTDAAQANLLIGMGKAEPFTVGADASELTVSIETAAGEAAGVEEPAIEAAPDEVQPIETTTFQPVVETTVAPRQKQRKPAR